MLKEIMGANMETIIIAPEGDVTLVFLGPDDIIERYESA